MIIKTVDHFLQVFRVDWLCEPNAKSMQKGSALVSEINGISVKQPNLPD